MSFPNYQAKEKAKPWVGARTFTNYVLVSKQMHSDEGLYMYWPTTHMPVS